MINKKNKIIEYTKNNVSTINNEKDIVVNYSCFCKKFFISNQKILYILPCCHMVHENCFNDYIIKTQYDDFDIKKKSSDTNTDSFEKKALLKCPFCDGKIKTVLSEYKINSKKKYHQYKIDIKSVKLDDSSTINYMILPLSIVKFTSFINKLILTNSKEDLLSTVELALRSFNIKIK